MLSILCSFVCQHSSFVRAAMALIPPGCQLAGCSGEMHPGPPELTVVLKKQYIFSKEIPVEPHRTSRVDGCSEETVKVE